MSSELGRKLWVFLVRTIWVLAPDFYSLSMGLFCWQLCTTVKVLIILDVVI